MTFNSIVALISVLISLSAAIAAAYSAINARQAQLGSVTAERERRIRELYLLAHRVDAAGTDAIEVGSELISAYESMFMLAGQGLNSSRLEIYKGQVADSRESVKPMQDEAHKLLQEGLEELSDKLITDHLLKLDGHLVRVQRICRKLESELDSVETHSRELRGFRENERRLP